MLFATALAAAVLVPSAQSPPADPAPATLEAFKAEATRVLAETGVPGAGLARVGPNGIEWTGGLGWADRDRRVPVTADTHAGSISKPFVALALVQLYDHVLVGRGVFLLSNGELTMQAGDMLVAAEGVPHGIRNTGSERLAVLVILAPGPHS